MLERKVAGAVLIVDFREYLQKILESLKPISTAIGTFLFYIFFPEPAYLAAFQALLFAMLLDFVTKAWAISKIPKAKLSSKSFMQGTMIKLVSYMIVFILTGLSYRVSPVAGVAVFLGTFVYTAFFIREAISIVENLCDVGANLEWLLLVLRKREDKLMEDELQGKVTEKSEFEFKDERHGGIQ